MPFLLGPSRGAAQLRPHPVHPAKAQSDGGHLTYKKPKMMGCVQGSWVTASIWHPHMLTKDILPASGEESENPQPRSPVLKAYDCMEG